jgi:TRAP-type C4-dicarboxylate transport system permease small subunit
MEKVLTWNRAVARSGLWLGGAVMLAAALLIGVDILLRVGFNRAIDGADEISRFALATATSWSLAGALLERAHIRVDTAYMRFPTPLKIVADIAGLVAFLGCFALVLVFGIELLVQYWHAGSRSSSSIQVPMIYPQGVWVAGLVMLLGCGSVLLGCSVRLLLTRRFDALQSLIGIKSAEAEVAEEIEHAATTSQHGAAL